MTTETRTTEAKTQQAEPGATPPQEKTIHPAAAGGDPSRQLRHLRGHREFQRQGIFKLLEIDWCTKITRKQSRLHIIRDLHAKINAKGENESSGKMDTQDGQKDLERFARIIRNRERVEHCGYGNQLPWKLRHRMIRSSRPSLTDAQFEDLMQADHPEALMPKRYRFPLWAQQRILDRERLRELLRLQGLSPRKHRDAAILQAYRCGGCRNFVRRDTADDGKCPVCSAVLQPWQLAEIACRPGPEPQPVSPEGFRKIQENWNGPLGRTSMVETQTPPRPRAAYTQPGLRADRANGQEGKEPIPDQRG